MQIPQIDARGRLLNRTGGCLELWEIDGNSRRRGGEIADPMPQALAI